MPVCYDMFCVAGYVFYTWGLPNYDASRVKLHVFKDYTLHEMGGLCKYSHIIKIIHNHWSK